MASASSPPMNQRFAFDPRSVLLGFLSVVVWASTTATMLGSLAWTVSAVALTTVVASRHRFSISISNLIIAIVLMSALTLALYLLFATGSTEIALDVGARMVVRLIALTLLALAFVSIADPLALAAGVTRIVLPLRHIGLPVA